MGTYHGYLEFNNLQEKGYTLFLTKEKTMKLIMSALFLFSVTLSFANPDKDAGAYKVDREKFCKDVQRGEGRLMHCLKEHKDELSEGCKKHHEQMKEKVQAAKEACHEDAEKFCKDKEKGHGHVLKCLKANTDKLSAPCKEHLQSKNRH